MCTQGTPTLEELKLRYYELLIRYHEHQVRRGALHPRGAPGCCSAPPQRAAAA